MPVQRQSRGEIGRRERLAVDLRPAAEDIHAGLQALVAGGPGGFVGGVPGGDGVGVEVLRGGGVGSCVDETIIFCVGVLEAGGAVDGLVSDEACVGACDERVSELVVFTTGVGFQQVGGKSVEDGGAGVDGGGAGEVEDVRGGGCGGESVEEGGGVVEEERDGIAGGDR